MTSVQLTPAQVADAAFAPNVGDRQHAAHCADLFRSLAVHARHAGGEDASVAWRGWADEQAAKAGSTPAEQWYAARCEPLKPGARP